MEFPPEIRALAFDAIEQSANTVFITDARGVIVYANPAFEKMTGYTVAEALGKNANILKSGERTKAFYDEMWAALNGGRSWTGRFINKRKDGTTYPETVHIAPVKDGNGGITHFIAIRNDVARELALESQLAQGQKMEALGLLAGQIAHDFNNLLTIIIGSMELVKEDLGEGTIGLKMTSDILKTAKESAGMIKQLLMFARRQDDEKPPRPADLNAALMEEQALNRLLGPRIKMEYSLAPDLYQAKIRPEQITQVIMNLAINAKDAMPDGGTITISTANAAVGRDGNVPLPPGDYATITVADNGPGIPREIQEHIFEPFFTTKPKSKGTGLGLSIVYGIIKQRQGDILVDSRPGKGAAFTIYLPKA